MKPICIYALVATCLIAKGYSETIQCYECDDCKKLNNDMLQPCPRDVTTLSPSSGAEFSSEASSSIDASTTITATTLADTEKAGDISAEEDHKARNSRYLNYKSVMKNRSTKNTVSYQCFSLVKAGTEDQQVRKGCVEVPANKKGCDVLKEVEGVSEENCKVCSESKCNSSVGLKYSIVTVFLVSLMKVFF